MLSGRLGRLPDAERNVLQRAAVAGREFSRGAVAALTDTPVDAQLLSLSRRGLIHAASDAAPGDDGYRFHHVLLRDAAYETLTKRERAALHERSAAWLDRAGPGDDALVGYHLEQAVLLRRELGEDADADASRRAARRCCDARLAPERHARGRGPAPPGDGSAGSRRRTAGGAAVRARSRRSSTQASAATRLSARQRTRGRPAASESPRGSRSSAHDLGFQAGGTSAAELLETALESIEVLTSAGDDRALGRAWLAVSDVHQWACRYADAAEAVRMASESYARASFSPAVIYSALASSLLFGPTHVRDAIAECGELRGAAPDGLTEANVSTRVGALAALDGRFEDARALCKHAREIYEDLGNTGAVNRIWSTSAVLVERRAGALDAAIAIARGTTRYFERQDDRAYASTWAARLAELLYWSEQYDEAERSVAAAREEAVAHDVYVQFLWRSTAAKLAARDGRAEEADRLSMEALRLAAASDSPLLLADLWVARAEVLQLGEQPTAAAEAAERARALLREKGDSAGLAEVERLLSRRKTENPSGLSV